MTVLKRLRYRRKRRAIGRLIKLAKRLIRRANGVSERGRKHLEEAIAAAQQARSGEAEIGPALSGLDAAIHESEYSAHMMSPRLRSLLELVFYIGLALTIRAFLFEPFKIPTGSMKPTLLHGDHVFIKKFRYGPRVPFTTDRIWRGEAPRRGEIVVFNFPMDPSQDYIKRVIGLPGDRLRVVDGRVEINGHFLEQKQGGAIDFQRTDDRRLVGHTVTGELVLEKIGERWVRTIHGPDIHPFYNDWPRAYFMRGVAPGPVAFDRPGSGLTCTPHHCKVDADHVFTMGDNRDGSADSRIWGGVPINFLRGAATVIWFSHDWTQPTLPLGPFTIGKLRWDRLFSNVNEEATLPLR
jgi:signal peptidase I